jgi:hypothetical protein
MAMSLAVTATVAIGSMGLGEAASESCWTQFSVPECTTRAIPANAQNHFVHVSVGPFQTYSVNDTDMHVQVAHGTNGILGTERTITGLTNHYNAHIGNLLTSAITGSSVTITNT